MRFNNLRKTILSGLITGTMVMSSFSGSMLADEATPESFGIVEGDNFASEESDYALDIAKEDRVSVKLEDITDSADTLERTDTFDAVLPSRDEEEIRGTAEVDNLIEDGDTMIAEEFVEINVASENYVNDSSEDLLNLSLSDQCSLSSDVSNDLLKMGGEGEGFTNETMDDDPWTGSGIIQETDSMYEEQMLEEPTLTEDALMLANEETQVNSETFANALAWDQSVVSIQNIDEVFADVKIDIPVVPGHEDLLQNVSGYQLIYKYMGDVGSYWTFVGAWDQVNNVIRFTISNSLPLVKFSISSPKVSYVLAAACFFYNHSCHTVCSENYNGIPDYYGAARINVGKIDSIELNSFNVSSLQVDEISVDEELTVTNDSDSYITYKFTASKAGKYTIYQTCNNSKSIVFGEEQDTCFIEEFSSTYAPNVSLKAGETRYIIIKVDSSVSGPQKIGIMEETKYTVNSIAFEGSTTVVSHIEPLKLHIDIDQKQSVKRIQVGFLKEGNPYAGYGAEIDNQGHFYEDSIGSFYVNYLLVVDQFGGQHWLYQEDIPNVILNDLRFTVTPLNDYLQQKADEGERDIYVATSVGINGDTIEKLIVPKGIHLHLNQLFLEQKYALNVSGTIETNYLRFNELNKNITFNDNGMIKSSYTIIGASDGVDGYLDLVKGIKNGDIITSLNGEQVYHWDSVNGWVLPGEESVCIEHIWDNGIETVKPTTAMEGVRTYACTVCGAKRTETIAKLLPETSTLDNGTGNNDDTKNSTEGATENDKENTSGKRPEYSTQMQTDTEQQLVNKTGEEKAFEIVPVNKETNTISKVPSSVKAKAKKNKVTVTWKKIKKAIKDKKLRKKIKGVHVQCATDKAFTDIVVEGKVNANKTKMVLKLQKKKTYFVRVRYVGTDGVSKWTKAKRVKTK